MVRERCKATAHRIPAMHPATRIPHADAVDRSRNFAPRRGCVSISVKNWENGAPERIRTSDPQIRSLVLYPAELRAPAETAKGVAPASEAFSTRFRTPLQASCSKELKFPSNPRQPPVGKSIAAWVSASPSQQGPRPVSALSARSPIVATTIAASSPSGMPPVGRIGLPAGRFGSDADPSRRSGRTRSGSNRPRRPPFATRSDHGQRTTSFPQASKRRRYWQTPTFSVWCPTSGVGSGHFDLVRPCPHRVSTRPAVRPSSACSSPPLPVFSGPPSRSPPRSPSP